MIALIISVNILLSVTVIGACAVWLYGFEVNMYLSLSLCLFTVIGALSITWIACKKAIAEKKKRMLLFVMIPIVVFLCIITFRNCITDFLYATLLGPIGPGGLPPEMLN